MRCAIHLLLDDRLSGLIQERPYMTHFDIAYANRTTMSEALRAFDYDAVFLTAENIELLESIKETNAHRAKTILVAKDMASFPEFDHVIREPLDHNMFMESLRSIEEIDRMLKICAFIRHMKRALSLSSSDAGIQAERMPVLVKTICEELKSDPKYKQIHDRCYFKQVAMYSSIHDIGKIGINSDVLNYPGIYDEKQREIMKKHVKIGADLYVTFGKMHDIEISDVGYNMIRHHHERYDGYGYPDGLIGESIPLEARIVGIADVYDALMSKRIYKKSTDPDRVLSILDEESGKHFDPALVRIMKKHHDTFKKLYLSE